MFAKVVIDIKHEEVNQLYDYIVPESFQDFLVRGMRVIVPFGLSSSPRLGIVIETTDQSLSATKEILEVLDAVPVIDDEIFYMLKEMAQGSLELISALYQTAIPTELLVSYQKVVKLINKDKIPLDLNPFFNTRGVWRLKKKDQIYYHRIRRLKEQKVIDIETVIREKKTEKKEAYYRYNQEHNYPRITKYPMLDEQTLSKEELQKEDLLQLGLTDSMINTLVKHDVLRKYLKDVMREIEHVYPLESKQITLTDEQAKAVHEITHQKKHSCFLLKGITGSGKTEVYLEAIQHHIAKKQSVLLLVPEIQQIPQMAMRIQSRFKDLIIYHSSLSKGERYDQYRKLINSDVSIVLGTRSALFLPIKQLSLIIIDEEHDESYIQKEGVFYDARELLIARAKYLDIPIVFGSATPSIEAMYKAKKKTYHLLELTKRPFDLELPKVTFVDMKEELKAKHLSIFSRPLLKAIEDRLAKKEQTILFLNRKGYAPFVMCRACGDVPHCPNCDISLAFYKDKKILKCPYCGYEVAYQGECRVCHEPKVREVGIGIEYVHEQLHKQIPKAKVIRMDQSSTKTKLAHEILWHDFKEEKADILIGTQMVTKGLDFPKVTLVGILMSDMLLKIPSYQSSEKAYMTLMQAIGRSGRNLDGEAIIQGYDLSHFAIKSIEKGYDFFYKEAIYQRKLLGYQPFNKTSQILFSGSQFLKTYQVAFLMKRKCVELGFEVLGPSQALIKRIKDNYRFTLTLKYQDQPMKPLYDLIQAMRTDLIHIQFLPTLDIW